LYALGCVLFELLAGRTPFVGEAMAEVLQQHIRQAPPKIASFVVECPDELENLIAQLLHKDPEQRPQSAQVVGARLKAIDEAVTVRAPRATRYTQSLTEQSIGGQAESVVVPTSGRSWNGMLVATLVLALAAVAWLFASQMRQGRLNEQAERLLVASIKDSSQPSMVRIFSAKSLGAMGPDAQNAIEPLLQCMKDPDPVVRTEIARSIAKIGTDDAYLVASLRKIQERDEQPDVRAAIDDAMGTLRKKPAGGSVVPYLIAAAGLSIFAGAGYWVWKQAKEAE
jgi:serine/threonine protein kinase